MCLLCCMHFSAPHRCTGLSCKCIMLPECISPHLPYRCIKLSCVASAPRSCMQPGVRQAGHAALSRTQLNMLCVWIRTLGMCAISMASAWQSSSMQTKVDQEFIPSCTWHQPCTPACICLVLENLHDSSHRPEPRGIWFAHASCTWVFFF